MKPKIILIVAAAQSNRVIGNKDNQIPWPRLKEDMAHFRNITLGHPIIMGRVTFETFIVKGEVKPLPQRQNIVITRNSEYVAPENVWIADSREDAIRKSQLLNPEYICVIGGEQIYEMFLPLADEIYYTRIELEVEGTTRFPEIPSQFNLDSAEDLVQADAKFPDGTIRPVEYQIQKWVKK